MIVAAWVWRGYLAESQLMLVGTCRVGYTGPTYATQLGPQMITIKVRSCCCVTNTKIWANILTAPDRCLFIA
jgi:hypothetical protein